MKLAKILEYVLLGLSAILLVAFFMMPHNTASDQVVNIYLVWTYVLLFATLVILLLFLFIKTFSSKKGILGFLLLVVGVVVLCGISYVLAKGGPVPTNVPYTEQVSKLTDASLILTYILIAGSVVALLGSSLVNAIRNR